MTLTTIDETSKILAFSGDDDDNAGDDEFKEKDLGLEGEDGIEDPDSDEPKEDEDDLGLGNDDDDDDDDGEGEEE